MFTEFWVQFDSRINSVMLGEYTKAKHYLFVSWTFLL